MANAVVFRVMEDTAFHQEYFTLHTGIRSGVDTLAMEAFADDLVCEEVKNKATSPTTDRHVRTRAFLDGIQDRIKTDPEAFYKFVDLLRRKPAYEHLAKKLETRKGELDSHPKSVAESQNQRHDTAATYRGMPNHRGSLFSGRPVCPNETEIGSSSKIRHFLSPPSQRRGPLYRDRRATPPGPRPTSGPSPDQKMKPHPLELDPSSERDSGCIESPDSFSSSSTDGEDSKDFSDKSSEQITVLTTVPTPVSEEQSISGPCERSGIVPEKEQRNTDTPVANPQTHSGSKLTVSLYCHPLSAPLHTARCNCWCLLFRSLGLNLVRHPQDLG